MAAILILISTVSIIALFLLWKYSYWYRRGVPQGNPLKLFGDLNDLAITTTQHVEQYLALGRKFSSKPFYGVYSLTSPYLVVRDEDMIKEVLLRKFNSFGSNGFEVDETVEPIISRDPFFQPNGERWKETRTSFSSLMTPGRLRAMMSEIGEACKETIQHLKDQRHESGKGDGADVKTIASRTMTNLLVRLTVSLDAGCFKTDGQSPFLKAEREMFDQFSSTSFSILTFLAPKLGQLLGVQFLPKSVVDFYTKVVRDQRVYRKANGITRNDIFDTIMKKSQESQKPEGSVDLDVVSVIVLFIMEGFETTSTNIATTIAELARRPDLQDTLREQILDHCPLGMDITEEALNDITLLQNCLLEGLRLYPPLLMTKRVATEPVTLEAKTGEKIALEKGSKLYIPIYAYQRDPEFFPDPETFDPHRIDDENQKRRILGFGDGPRQCPGQRFAVQASKVLLAMILREFKLELSPKTPMPIKTINNAFLLSIKDILIRFVPA